jgi:hypothetical protein
MKRFSIDENIKISKIMKKTDLDILQKQVADIHIDDNIYLYIKDLVFSSRQDHDIKQYLLY